MSQVNSLRRVYLIQDIPTLSFNSISTKEMSLFTLSIKVYFFFPLLLGMEIDLNNPGKVGIGLIDSKPTLLSSLNWDSIFQNVRYNKKKLYYPTIPRFYIKSNKIWFTLVIFIFPFETYKVNIQIYFLLKYT